MNNKLYALVGPHACGKSTIIQELIRRGVNYIPLYTTRSPDSYVHNPVSAAKMYRFIEKEDFFKQDFLVKITYKGEYYGMMKQEILGGYTDRKDVEVIRHMVRDGIEMFIEVGPGETLSGFVRKTEKEVKAHNVEDKESLELAVASLKEALAARAAQ